MIQTFDKYAPPPPHKREPSPFDVPRPRRLHDQMGIVRKLSERVITARRKKLKLKLLKLTVGEGFALLESHPARSAVDDIILDTLDVDAMCARVARMQFMFIPLRVDPNARTPL